MASTTTSNAELIDPTWCDCPEGYPSYGIDKYKHLPLCRYGIIEDWLDSQRGFDGKNPIRGTERTED